MGVGRGLGDRERRGAGVDGAMSGRGWREKTVEESIVPKQPYVEAGLKEGF